MMNNTTIYQDIDQIVSITHDTVNKLSSYKNGGDAIILYFRYIQQKKMQNNTTTFSCDDFMIKAMKWGKSRFYKTKKVLIDNKLIEVVNKKDNMGRIQGWYIKVNFIIKSPTLPENESLENPESGKQETNTLVLNINTPIEKENTLCDDLNNALSDFQEMRKQIKKKMTDKAMKLLLNELERLAPGDDAKKIAILNKSILNSWQGVFPLKEGDYKSEADEDRNNYKKLLIENRLQETQGNHDETRQKKLRGVAQAMIAKYTEEKVREYRKQVLSSL